MRNLYIEQIIKNENAQVKNILELACGTGNITIPLAKKNYDIAGIDISDEMLNVARSKGEEQGIDLVLLEQDISELDFDVTNLDCVFIFYYLFYIVYPTFVIDIVHKFIIDECEISILIHPRYRSPYFLLLVFLIFSFGL